MKARIQHLALLFTGVLLVAGFVAQPPAKLTVKPGTKMTLSGTSTMHDWTCDVKDVQGTMDAGLPAKNTITGVTLTIPVESIDCGKGPMNKRLQKEMNVKANPNITFKLTSAKPGKNGAWTVAGQVTAAGVTKPVSFPATMSKSAAGVTFKGSVPLKMTAFSVKPPVFLGIKTGDDIKIDFDLVVG